ncbi:response regulator transcription factor [Paenibacillus lutrae]|uniref:Response regulator n=1 Tax=Paenibacillus lutrae TaxID=2078573 RepID=A0A7X3FKH3_9BACL|nr:response regulator transcription factor [Paenibacillus lutrae]MVP01385.1 response regulator [Paenibacillus lutrae]
MHAGKILVVDDDHHILEIVSLYLRREGFEIITADHGDHVLQMVAEQRPDLILLDILLPGVDGIELCRQLRKTNDTPIIFLSAKSEDIDIILGLSIGGDDYVTKPFSPGQLVARVKSLLRRCSPTRQLTEPHILKFPDLEIDLHSHIVKVRDQPIALSAKEFDLLSLLAQNPNRVYRIEQLFEQVWSLESFGDPRTLIVHISNLRKKIEPNPSEPRFIITVRGVGYKFHGTPL